MTTKESYKCVDKKVRATGYSIWLGDMVGKFTDKTCANMCRPCFVWSKGDFWLLPLPEDARLSASTRDVKYWVLAEPKMASKQSSLY